MADTFLNTARTTGVATSNVQENINQANGQQTVQNNVNGTNGIAQQSQVNPITIPIQIQPQIAPTGQPQTIDRNVQPNQNLQVNNAQPSYNAPTPQTYQGNNNSSNVVDFNQIYKSYNDSLGRNNNQPTTTASGIKKSSYNTTIVTPTTINLNSVEGQYQSAYADTINGVISTMLTQVEQLRTGDFGYDPTQDMALRMASEYAANSTLQSLAGSGVLNSSATAERVARIVSELIPQYEEKAYNRQVQYLSQLADTAQLVMNFDNQQFQYWQDAKDREFKEKEFEFNKQQKSLENAWKRVDELGYVDNEASTILGVKVGTLSASAREAKEQREFELEKMKEQLSIEHANNVALTKLKVELETQQEKELASYNNMLQTARMELQSKLDTQKSKELASYNNMLDQQSYAYKTNLDTQKSKELASYNDSLDRNTYAYKSNIDTQKSKEVASYNNALEKDLANYKTQLSTQQSKELAAYENELNIQKNKELAEYENQLNLKYNKELTAYENSLKQSSSSKTNSSNLATYDEIIKNRFAEYDDFTKQYVVPDQQTYNELGNYLDNLYASKAITETEVMQLSAKYSKYNGQINGSSSSGSNLAQKAFPTLYSMLNTLNNWSNK